MVTCVKKGDNGYGSLSSHSASMFAGLATLVLNLLFFWFVFLSPYMIKILPYIRLPPPSLLEMVIPAHAIGKVIGKNGTNIDTIRKVIY